MYFCLKNKKEMEERVSFLLEYSKLEKLSTISSYFKGQLNNYYRLGKDETHVHVEYTDYFNCLNLEDCLKIIDILVDSDPITISTLNELYQFRYLSLVVFADFFIVPLIFDWFLVRLTNYPKDAGRMLVALFIRYGHKDENHTYYTYIQKISNFIQSFLNISKNELLNMIISRDSKNDDYNYVEGLVNQKMRSNDRRAARDHASVDLAATLVHLRFAP